MYTKFKRWLIFFLIALFLCLSLPQTVQAAVEEQATHCAQYHTVLRGENLFRIARRYGTTYQALQRLNNLPNANRILVGQRLCVQGVTSTPGDPVVVPTPQQFVMALQTVRLRSGPGTQYAIVGRVFAGMTARVTGTSGDGRWWRVLCPDDSVGSCWVSADPTLTRPTEIPNQVREATAESISVTILESYPVQVVATVRGTMPDSCVYIDTFRQFRQDRTFRIEWTTGRNPGSCTQALTPFELTVTLDTAGLPGGAYTVVADSVQAGFNLSQ